MGPRQDDAVPDPPDADEAPAEAKKVEALPPRHRLTYSNLTGARVNPLGFENRTTFGIEERLWNNPGILTRDAYVGLKLAPVLNPAQVRLGGQIEELDPPIGLGLAKPRAGHELPQRRVGVAFDPVASCRIGEWRVDAPTDRLQQRS